LQALRSLLLAGCNLCFSTALAHIPLADAAAIGFASPLLTVAAARLWLGEKVSPRRWAGVAVGLAGVVLALRPSFLFAGAPMPPWALLPLGTAVLYTAYQLLTRRLAAVDPPHTTILHTGMAATLATSLAQPFVWMAPPAADWLLLAMLGLLGGAGHGLLVLAFSKAPASLLAPMSYAQLPMSLLAGVLVFGDWPGGLALAGMAVIIGGGVLVALPERRRPGTQTEV
jgi:drug/metabolite transporter (DMT)-like permease